MASEPEVNGAPANGTSGKKAEIGAPSTTVGDNNKENRIEESRKRCIFMYQALVGYAVRVQAKHGVVYQGVFSSITSKEITLKMARLIRDENGPVRTAQPEKILAIPYDDWQRIDADDVKLHPSDLGPIGANKDDAGGFGTDSAISRGRGGQVGRELERWTPDSVDRNNPSFAHLEDSVSASRGWDQFALNEARFGVKTDYKEELYTTALDPSKSKISMEEAARIAAEIERGSKNDTNNIHLLEERGIEIDDGDIDEEDRYGAVMRDTSGSGMKGVVAPPPPPPSKPGSKTVPRPPAWSRGPPSSTTSSSSPPPPPPSSAPINIDPRREANKVRAHMTGGAVSNKTTSPYGTPKSSHLSSPLVGDAQKLAALNLDPGVPKVDEATRREFQEFKAQQQNAKGSSNAPSLSDLKQFSEAVGTKLQKAGSNASSSAALTSSESSNITPPPPPPPGSSTDSGSTTKKSTLNPNAKSFSFNINAKEFNPVSFGPSSTANTTTTPGGSSGTSKPSSAPIPYMAKGPYQDASPPVASSPIDQYGHFNSNNPNTTNGRPTYHHHRDDAGRHYDKRQGGRHYNGPPPPPPGSHAGRGGASPAGVSPPVHQMAGMAPVMMPQYMVVPTNGQQFAYVMQPPRPNVFMPGAATAAGSPAYIAGPNGQPMMGAPIMMGPPPGGNVPMGPPPTMGGYGGSGGAGIPPQFVNGGSGGNGGASG